ncbi:MAG: hypothetical protein J5877_07410 [Clostridia bacterium]|nr:hypothetical protein [Clostridia bacterium]
MQTNTDMKNNKSLKITAIISGIFTAAICAVMNFRLIPIIESEAGMRCFDMNFGYNYDEAIHFLSNITEYGRDVYLHMQLPLDFIYPIAYCAFFCSLIYLLTNRKSSLLAIPVFLAIFDYIENILTVVMLKGSIPSVMVANFASTATVFKTLIMYACFVIIVILIIIRIVRRKKA